MRFVGKFLLNLSFFVLVVPLPALGQGRQGFPQGGPADGTISVYLRDEFGSPLSVIPQLKLTVVGMGIGFPSEAQHIGRAWVFSNLTLSQEYEVEVKADGYQTAHESVTLPPMDHASQNVIVFMTPVGQKKVPRAAGGTMLAPRAQKEVDHGLKDLHRQKFDSAEKHLSKALAMAPASPYVNYVMGMIYLLSQQLPKAEQYLAKSVSIDPREPPALLALGTVRLQLNENASAIQALDQDVRLDAKSWKGEWMLANAYLRQGNYAQAREYAEKAIDTGKADAAPAELILGEALAGLGEREKAVSTFQTYLEKYPNDSRATQIREYVERLQRNSEKPMPVAASASAPSGPENTVQSAASMPPAEISAPPPPVELPPKENWAPPDVDATKPFVISGTACSLPNVMKAAASYAETFVSTLSDFTATEEYQSVEIKGGERLETPDTRTYSYLAQVAYPNPRLIEVREFRDSRSGAKETPGLLADNGAPALALAFHPLFSGSFDWSCEGLGEWKGKSAWVVHFEQRKDKPTSLLQAFETASQEYALPLKGRAWVAENGGEIIHLETDLTHPIKQIGMLREHFSINYAPVPFRKRKLVLWLPEDADVYYHFQGHYIHHYHHYSDFRLFWVGTKEKDSSLLLPQ